jgi:hypothetical protein
MNKEKIYEEAYDYLLSFEDVDKDLIDKHLENWKNGEPKNLEKIYWQMLRTSYNRQGMKNSIGELNQLETVLKRFNPHNVEEAYNSWKGFFKAVEESSYSPPGRMDIDNSRSHWVQFSKSAISASDFLSEFEDLKEFEEFVTEFKEGKYTLYSLPLLLSERVHGFQFALGCDFLKEIGNPEFIKPDTHIKDLFLGLEISDSNSDFDIFLDVVEFAEEIDKKPYEVDKLFWLVGSGKFHLTGKKINTDKKEFLKRISD